MGSRTDERRAGGLRTHLDGRVVRSEPTSAQRVVVELVAVALGAGTLRRGGRLPDPFSLSESARGEQPRGHSDSAGNQLDAVRSSHRCSLLEILSLYYSAIVRARCRYSQPLIRGPTTPGSRCSRCGGKSWIFLRQITSFSVTGRALPAVS